MVVDVTVSAPALAPVDVIETVPPLAALPLAVTLPATVVRPAAAPLPSLLMVMLPPCAPAAVPLAVTAPLTVVVPVLSLLMVIVGPTPAEPWFAVTAAPVPSDRVPFVAVWLARN